MRRIAKRLETLERAADKELFADAFPFAIAYYLGGARNLKLRTLTPKRWVTKIWTNLWERPRICLASNQPV